TKPIAQLLRQIAALLLIMAFILIALMNVILLPIFLPVELWCGNRWLARDRKQRIEKFKQEKSLDPEASYNQWLGDYGTEFAEKILHIKSPKLADAVENGRRVLLKVNREKLAFRWNFLAEYSARGLHWLLDRMFSSAHIGLAMPVGYNY